MALLDKPNMKEVWASGGAAVKPSDEKIQTGWAAEVPPYQYENWIQGRQDQYLAHINQRGVPQWDGETEYEGSGLSYTQGTDGVVYKSVGSSGPSGTVQDPTTDVDGIYWEKAFADNDDPRVVSAVPNTRQVIAGDGLSGGGDLTANRTLSVNYGTTAGTAVQGNDSRLSDSREWTADTVSKEAAEAGTSTERKAWTAQRVRQAADAAITNRVVHTTGYSETNVMSQKAVSDQLLGVGQTWQDVTASRSSGVNYTNTTGRPIFVSITGVGGDPHAIRIIVDGIAIIQNRNGFQTSSDSIDGCLTIVPNGSTYSQDGSAMVNRWVELR